MDQLLAEQRDLTAVERFAEAESSRSESNPARLYQDLIPLNLPRPGEQYAFEVDLDRCSSCKACVTACHSLNGLDEEESWRDIGLLLGSESLAVPAAPDSHGFPPGAYTDSPSSRIRSPHSRVIPLQQTVTTACHHCVEPGCLQGCPVLAYDKDPVTGIVQHLDDQCIGCSYCILKCPYDVPKYSASRGIVRKCDLCHGRLAAGEAPACAQACPDQAIRITLVDRQEVLDLWRRGGEAVPAHRRPQSVRPKERMWLPDAPPADLTLPTTRYLSRRPMASWRAADHDRPRPEPAHWPLVIMLLFTQAGAGTLLGGFFTILMSTASEARVQAAAGFLLLQAGLVAAVFHLGQPLKAWRSFLGWRTSWLSREILAFGALAGAASGLVFTLWAPPAFNFLSGTAGFWWTTTGLASLVAVFASAMVYIDTGRLAWNRPDTLHGFFGGTFLLGASGSAVVIAWQEHWDPAGLLPAAQAFGVIALILRTILYLSGWLNLRMARANPTEPQHAASRVLDAHLPWVSAVRVWLFLAATATSLLGLTDFAHVGLAWMTVSFVITAASQLLERYIFFVAAAPWRMPGLPQ